MSNRGFVARGGLWVLGQFVLIALVLLAGLLFPGHERAAAARRWGGALLWVGAVLGLTGAWALGRRLTPFIRPLATESLVQHGIYRWIRHPLYSSLMFASVGWAVFQLSLAAGALAGVFIVFLILKARREEAFLTGHFPEYAAYCQRTKRFVPGLW